MPRPTPVTTITPTSQGQASSRRRLEPQLCHARERGHPVFTGIAVLLKAGDCWIARPSRAMTIFWKAEALPAAERPAKEIADRASWPAPWRWRLAVRIALRGIARIERALIGVAVCRTPVRPLTTVRARAFGDGRGFDPARRAAIRVLHLHPAWLARDHPHLPARGKRVDQRRLHRGL